MRHGRTRGRGRGTCRRAASSWARPGSFRRDPREPFRCRSRLESGCAPNHPSACRSSSECRRPSACRACRFRADPCRRAMASARAPAPSRRRRASRTPRRCHARRHPTSPSRACRCVRAPAAASPAGPERSPASSRERRARETTRGASMRHRRRRETRGGTGLVVRSSDPRPTDGTRGDRTRLYCQRAEEGGRGYTRIRELRRREPSRDAPHDPRARARSARRTVPPHRRGRPWRHGHGLSGRPRR